jgi:hypothetical protein
MEHPPSHHARRPPPPHHPRKRRRSPRQQHLCHVRLPQHYQVIAGSSSRRPSGPSRRQRQSQQALRLCQVRCRLPGSGGGGCWSPRQSCLGFRWRERWSGQAASTELSLARRHGQGWSGPQSILEKSKVRGSSGFQTKPEAQEAAWWDRTRWLAPWQARLTIAAPELFDH